MAIDDSDLIDPDPEARRSKLGASAWLDHCREADAFLIDALKVLDGDRSSADVSAARKKETASVACALERVRVNVTSRPNETLVKMANVGLLPGGVKPANVLLPGDVKSRGVVECEHFTLSRQCCLDRKQLRCEAAAIPVASSP